MSDKFYVGFGHHARQGKDTIARAIHTTYPALTRVIGFADALKAYCRVNYDMTIKDPALLQRIGVEVREKNPDTWINVLRDTVADYPEPIILIPDTRFMNEAHFVHHRDGLLVRVRRLDENGHLVLPTDRDPDHVSETELAEYPWDVTIDAQDGDTTALLHEAQRLGAAILVAWSEDQHRKVSVPRVVLH